MARPDYSKIALMERQLGLRPSVEDKPGLLTRLADRFLPWVRTEKQIEERAMGKALDAFMGAIGGDEQLTKAFSGVQPGTNVPNTGGPGLMGSGLNQRLMSRLSQNLASNFQMPPEKVEEALARQGMSWGPPFPPGRPLNPYWGYNRAPRSFDFSVGENTQITPRWGRISFQTIRALWDAYDVAQICTKHLINDVRSLDYHFEANIGVRDDVSEDIIKAREFFDSPDKAQPFRSWLSKYLTDVIRYDAGVLHVRRNTAGEPIALEVVNGATVIPLIDYYGRTPSDTNDNDPQLTPAGLYEGKITPAYVQIIQGMPWDWLTKDNIIYQPLNPQPDSQYGLAPLEAVLLTANTDLRFQWHFLQFFTDGSIPQGFMQAPEGLADPAQIAEWQSTWDAIMIGDQSMLRKLRWVPFGSKYEPVGPAAKDFNSEFPLYLMRRTCAAHGVTPADLGFTETVNKATSEVQVDVQFRVGTLPIVRHVEDVLTQFLTQSLKLKVRLRFDTGREIEDRLATAQAEQIYINSGVMSADEPRQRLGYPVSLHRPTPRFVQNTRSGPIPLVAIESMSGPIDPETFAPTKDAPLIDHPFHEVPGVVPPIGSRSYTEAQNATALMQENLMVSGSQKPSGGKSDGKSGGKSAKPDTGGGGGKGMMIDPKLGPQIEGNKPPMDRYGSEGGPKEGEDLTHPKLDQRNPVKPSSQPANAKPKPRKQNPVKKGQKSFGAGIAVVAQDTGRVLMLQRSYADDKKKSAGKWEFPGGIPDPGESGLDAAKREWQEETGNLLPAKGVVTSTWNAPDGHYTLYVYAVKFEQDVLLNPDRDDMQTKDPDHPNAFQTEVMAWWTVDDIKDAGKAIRKDLRESDFDWDLLSSAASAEISKEGGAGAGPAGPSAGITAATGMTGSDLSRPKDDDDDDDEAVKDILRKWRENAKHRMKKGLRPRHFADPELPVDVVLKVWEKLGNAQTSVDIDEAFKI